MTVSDAQVFPGFLTPVLTQLFFPKPPTTFLTCFCRGNRRKYAGKKVCLNQGSNSQPGHESNMLTTEPPRRGWNSEAASLIIQKLWQMLSFLQTHSQTNRLQKLYAPDVSMQGHRNGEKSNSTSPKLEFSEDAR